MVTMVPAVPDAGLKEPMEGSCARISLQINRRMKSTALLKWNLEYELAIGAGVWCKVGKNP
jgi:hypothetical protein